MPGIVFVYSIFDYLAGRSALRGMFLCVAVLLAATWED